MRIDREKRRSAEQRARELLVGLLLEARRQYLRTGANALKHWDQLLSRLRSSAMTSGTVDEMMTAFLRGLQIEAPSSSLSSAIRDLSRAVEDWRFGAVLDDIDVLELIDREHGLILAMARMVVEDAKQAAKEQG